jgi:hypothetical protein
MVFRSRAISAASTVLAVVLALCAGLCGCASKSRRAGSSDAAVVADGPPFADVVPFSASLKGEVRFKGAERIEADFTQALQLKPTKLCNELDRYSCIGLVHRIALAGVEPYRLSLYEAPQHTPVSAPIAVERVALSGCVRRVDIDLGRTAGTPLIFHELEIGADGRLVDPQGDGAGQALQRLAERVWLRPARQDEIAALRQLYQSAAKSNSSQPARDWAVLACFTVLTSLESLFY